MAEWKAAALDALKPKRKPSGDSKRVRELEKQLRRKDKALVEAAALLVLQKKAQLSGGRGRRHGAEERRMIMTSSTKPSGVEHDARR